MTTATTAEAGAFVAEFPKVAQAKSFEARLHEGGNWVVAGTISRSGKAVHWVADVELAASKDVDLRTLAVWMAEQVGYYGSPPQGPRATLNGIPTPRSY